MVALLVTKNSRMMLYHRLKGKKRARWQQNLPHSRTVSWGTDNMGDLLRLEVSIVNETFLVNMQSLKAS